MCSPFFTIIVPVYNSELVLDRCIKSILNQTYKNFKLLLIDDGSQDNSKRICYDYSIIDSRIAFIFKDNGGVSSARNVGIENAFGDWVVFCDSDDWVYPEWLSNYVKIMDESDMISQGCRCEYNSLVEDNVCCDVAIRFTGTPSDYLDKMFQLDQVGYVWNKCFKLSLINKFHLRFDERFNFREDEEFVLRYMAHCAKISSTDSIGYYYVVPDFIKKYAFENNSYELYTSLYISSMKITAGKTSGYILKLRQDLTSRFINDFSNETRFRYKRSNLLNYKRLLGIDILTLNIFWITKYLILVDFTGFSSTIFLTLQLKFKYFLLSK